MSITEKNGLKITNILFNFINNEIINAHIKFKMIKDKSISEYVLI